MPAEHAEDLPRGEAPVGTHPVDLLTDALNLTAHLDLHAALRDFVERAARITGARYAALGVLDSRGHTTAFLQHGVGENDSALISDLPHGRGVLGAIPDDGALVLQDLTHHPEFGGWPAGHPPMHAFLGVPVRIREQVFGRLYLAEKDGGFTEADSRNVQLLAQAAAVAVENARLYTEARNRERWMAVSQEITTTLLQGTEEEEALALIASRLREVAEADTALIILPSVGETYACEIADGHAAQELVGVVFPPEGRAMTVLNDRVGMIVDSMSRSRSLRVPQLARFGPALYVPLVSGEEGLGVIVLLRRVGQPEFAPPDLEVAELVAAQAALALQMAAARHAEDVAALLDERGRIGRDLHDLAIQQLFATGMQLESARAELSARGQHGLAEVIEQGLSSVDDSVRQIRSIVHTLREPDTAVVLVERLRREASLARVGLGFAPSLVIDVDGVTAEDGVEDDAVVDAVINRVDPDISDDVVAVVREGLANAARHAHARSVQVRVSVLGQGPTGRVVVEVEDDGGGLDPARTRRSGTDNLAARARQHGGTFALGHSERGPGTLLTWQVPLT